MFASKFIKFILFFLPIVLLLSIAADLLVAGTGSIFLVFTLSSQEVHELLSQTKPICQRRSDCILEPGDILIRRYLTSRTSMISMIFRMYFTHLAIYLGDGRIIEAIGVEPNREDDVKINELNDSDWTKESLEDLVILRPNAQSAQIHLALERITKIAGNPKYRFGIATLNHNDKMVTCADLIFYQFKDVDIIRDDTSPAIITPDYLFWYATKNPDKFSLVWSKF